MHLLCHGVLTTCLGKCTKCADLRASSAPRTPFLAAPVPGLCTRSGFPPDAHLCSSPELDGMKGESEKWRCPEQQPAEKGARAHSPLHRSQQAPLCLMASAQSRDSTGHFSLLQVTSLFWTKRDKGHAGSTSLGIQTHSCSSLFLPCLQFGKKTPR